MAAVKRETERIDWIDIAKGIAILAVILGHTVPGGGTMAEKITRGVIFSFHMPLFFILSSATFRMSSDNDQFLRKTEKAFRHLVIPAVSLHLLRVGLNVISHFDSIEWKSYLMEKINIFVFGSGVAVNVMGAFVPALGIPWFLLVLFLGRSLFDYLHLKLGRRQFAAALVVCTLSGAAFGKLQWLPFSFDIALAVMPFFAWGVFLKKIDIRHRMYLYGALSLVIWGSTLLLGHMVTASYLELACRRYTLFPLCYVMAIAGTMFFCYLSAAAERIKIMTPLKYLGRNSMYMLWVHTMDGYVGFMWSITGSSFINAGLRILVDIVLFLVLMKFMEFMKKYGFRPKEKISQ